jgi:hypothetical protein
MNAPKRSAPGREIAGAAKLRPAQSNSRSAIAQHVCGHKSTVTVRERQQRQLELTWFATRSLAEIRTTLAELAVWSQQTNDVLRRLLVTKFLNFAHVEQNSAKASGRSALQSNGPQLKHKQEREIENAHNKLHRIQIPEKGRRRSASSRDHR